MCCGNKSCRLGDNDDNDKLRDEMTDEETDDEHHAIGKARSRFQVRLATIFNKSRKTFKIISF